MAESKQITIVTKFESGMFPWNNQTVTWTGIPRTTRTQLQTGTTLINFAIRSNGKNPTDFVNSKRNRAIVLNVYGANITSAAVVDTTDPRFNGQFPEEGEESAE